MKKITIIQKVVPHYRKPFFTRLSEILEEKGIAMQLIYGQELPGTVPQSIELDQPWVRRVKNTYIPTVFGHAVWQPCLAMLRDSDLVITEQASSALLTYWLQFRCAFGQKLLAFWGQGINVRAKNPRSFPERVKSRLIGKVDWWFAYTEHTVGILASAGYPSDRITVVENAVEDDDFRKGIEAVTENDLLSLKQQLQITGDNVGLYCGAMIPPKRIDFLIEICHALKKRMPDFHAILIGGGPLQAKAEAAAAENPWIHYVGPKFAGERAPYFKLSRFLLQPGTVGLVCVDSFVAEVPLFTTDLREHGPEITFIKHDRNGYVAPDSLEAYVEAVCSYLSSPEQQQRLIKGCRESAPRYTIENMARNYASGVENCLRHYGLYP